MRQGMRSWLRPVDPTSPATENMSLQPAGAYSPPPEISDVISTRASIRVPRERRLWTAALAAALLLTAGGLGILYVDDTTNQATIRSVTTQNESLTGRNQHLQDQLTLP